MSKLDLRLHIKPLDTVDRAGEMALSMAEMGLNIVSTPLVFLQKTIDSFKSKKEVYLPPPPRLATALKGFSDAFKEYHLEIIYSGNILAGRVGKGTERLAARILTPITFCRTGISLQKILSEKVIGRLAHATSFAAFQVFHALPYILIATGATLINVVYCTAPVALVSIFLGSILFLQLFFLFKVNRGLEETNKLLLEIGGYHGKIANTVHKVGSWIPGRTALSS